MTPTDYIQYLIDRYEAILLLGNYPEEYYKSKTEWENELKTKIDELKNKLTK